MTNNTMSAEKERISQGYDKVASRIKMSDAFYNRCIAMYNSYAGKNILDVGCGQGLLLQKVHEKAPDATFSGVDISSVLVEMSKKNNPYATIAQGDAENLPFEDGKFDVIFMTEALEHMLDHNKAVAEVSRVLKEDGIFIVTVPNRDWLRFDFYEKMSESWQPVDDHFFRFEEIKGILLANKLEIVKYKGSDNLYYYGTLHKFEQVIAFFLPFLYKKMKRIMFVCKAVK